jgi:predicted MFS family arabinose efflux permease
MTPRALVFILAFVSVDVRILVSALPSIAAPLGATAGAAGRAMTSYALAYGGLPLVGAATTGVRSGRT